MPKLRIATWAGEYSGILQYRWTQPLYELRKRGHDIYILPNITCYDDVDYKKKIEVCANIIRQSDILFMISPGFYKTFEALSELKKVKPDLKLVGDFDDDQFNISPLNQAYARCGYKNAKVEADGEIFYLWEHGKNGFDVIKNRIDAKATANIISMLDLMTTTTERLKFKYRHYIDKEKIKVIPNAVNFEAFSLYSKFDKGDGKIRIVWPLSSSHLNDWRDIRKSLGNVLKRNKNVKLVTLGVEMGRGRDIPISQHEHVGWAMGYAEYLNNLFTSGADIGICPLADDRFNWKKSPIKWEEISAMGLPAVVSHVMYSDYVQDGVTGLVYHNHAEFEEKLQRLIDDAELRVRLGSAAQEHVREKYNVLIVANEYESAFEKICNKNKIIEVVA